MLAQVMQHQNQMYLTGLTASIACKVGDVVCITGTETVGPTVTAASHAFRIGVVVGGRQTFGVIAPVEDLNSIGAAAAAIGESVIILTRGICYIVADAAIPVGSPLAPSTTVAGRSRVATDSVVAAGGVAVTSTAANGAIITGDGLVKVFARLLAASSAAGDKRLAYINA